MGIKEKREMSKFTSQRNSKFTQATIRDGMSLAIFATNGMYIERVRFARLSMLFQCVFTFCKILFPFAFIKFASLKTQGAFLSCGKNMNIMTKENHLCTSQQGHEIKFALPN
jgi:hypothetical protein